MDVGDQLIDWAEPDGGNGSGQGRQLDSPARLGCD
jgi:hypothetical protein